MPLPFAIQLLQEPPNSLLDLVDPLIHFVLPTKRVLSLLAGYIWLFGFLRQLRRTLYLCRRVHLTVHIT